jgi:hypothetical protein
MKKMKRKTTKFMLKLILISHACTLTAQNMTDISLFLRSDSTTYLDSISSKTGNLYEFLGHHGPAIENEWFALRLYFNKTVAIDVYSKAKPGLELRKFRWYPNPEQQKKGSGADYYKVGSSVGLGGVLLWENNNFAPLHPVTKRFARVVKEGTVSFMEMLSEDVPYTDTTVDILIRVTVYSGTRRAKVEAFSLSKTDVKFSVCINYHQGQKVIDKDDCVYTWGFHPEDVAVEKVAIGAAIFINPDNFEQKINNGDQFIFITKPTKYISYWISSANEKECFINTLERFVDFSKMEMSH